MPNKVKISRGSAENGEEHLEFAEAAGRKACYDSSRELYTAELTWPDITIYMRLTKRFTSVSPLNI